MVVEVSRRGDLAVAVLRDARLDAGSVDAFKDAVYPLADAGIRAVQIDLTAVGFVDSSGLGAMVGLLKRLGPEGRVELTGVRPAIRRILDLTRMDEIFPIRAAVSGG